MYHPIARSSSVVGECEVSLSCSIVYVQFPSTFQIDIAWLGNRSWDDWKSQLWWCTLFLSTSQLCQYEGDSDMDHTSEETGELSSLKENDMMHWEQEWNKLCDIESHWQQKTTNRCKLTHNRASECYRVRPTSNYYIVGSRCNKVMLLGTVQAHQQNDIWLEGLGPLEITRNS